MIILVCCALLFSCQQLESILPGFHSEQEPEILSGNELINGDNDSSYEHFTISLSNMNPEIVHPQIGQSYWQKTSFDEDALNILDGVSLSDVGLSFIDYLGAQRSISYAVQFRINNNTDNSLHYTFPPRPPHTILEKNIDGQWYEVPLFGGTELFLRRSAPVMVVLDPRESSRHYFVDLAYWHPNTEGLYRLLIEVFFDSDSESQYFLSENFEIRLQDFRTRFSGGQVNSLEGLSMTITKYDYEADDLLHVIENKSELTFIYGYSRELEKYIDGYWYEVPVNTISPIGEVQGVWRAVAFTLYHGQESEAGIQLRNWYPLSIGAYRLTAILSANGLAGGREYFPVSAIFEIVE